MLKVQVLGRGFAWLDIGAHDSLSDASVYIETIEKRRGLKVACLEEFSCSKGWIGSEEFRDLANQMQINQYHRRNR